MSLVRRGGRSYFYMSVRKNGRVTSVYYGRAHFAELAAEIEWRADRGFGVSTPGEHDYGTGADEIYQSEGEALERVIDLIRSGGGTSPPKV